MEETKVEITQAELDKFNHIKAIYDKTKARSAKFKADHIEYTVKYNREYQARRMLDPVFKKKHYDAMQASRQKRRVLDKLDKPPPVRFRTKKHIFEIDNDIKTIPDII